MNASPEIKLVTDNQPAPNTKDVLNAVHTSEIVVALCGPIGSPIHKVAEIVKQVLLNKFSYECETIRLSKFIEERLDAPKPTKDFDRISALISKGNEMRRDHGASILAELAIHDIRLKRAARDPETKAVRICHIIDSIKNQEELDLLRLVYREMLYTIGVFSPLDKREQALKMRGLGAPEIYELIDRDSGEEIKNGQTVRNTFPQSDFFLRFDSDTDTQIQYRVERFLNLILETGIVTPTKHESAMYAAACAASHSACLSRQVGAALTNANGNVIAVGWNDVPKAGGNLYMFEPDSDPQRMKDKRCWNLEGGRCFNDKEKQDLAKNISDILVAENTLPSADADRMAADLVSSSIPNLLNKEQGSILTKNISDALVAASLTAKKAKQVADSVLEKSKLQSLTEFSRSVHAEMHAILNAGKTNGEMIQEGMIFVTTYPCHSCARHIVAAGIRHVYYIEPYRKSLATKLHSDAITENESSENLVKILPYDGVAPARFLALFKMKTDSRKANGNMIHIDPKSSKPRFEKSLEAVPALEGVVVKGLIDKNVVDSGEKNAAQK